MMSTNPFNELNSPDTDCKGIQDPPLDRLLAEARWPEPDAATVVRLQAVVSSGLAETNHSPEIRSLERTLLTHDAGDRLQSVDLVSRKALAAGECLNLTRETPAASALRLTFFTQSPDRMRRLAVATSITVALVIAFLTGRWTSTVPQGSIAEVQSVNSPRGDSPQTGPMEISSIQEQLPRPAENMVTVDQGGSPESDNGAESQLLQPKPDSRGEKQRRLTQRQRLQQQLDVVLACLEDGQDQGASCCQSLRPRRAEFEFLLGELIRSATGQRQLAAVTAMGFIGSDGAVPGLLQSASDERLREAAVAAVKRCSSEPMLAALVRQSGHSALAEEYVRELAHRSTPQAASVWLQLVQTPESRDLCLRLADELSPALVNILFAELDASLMDDRMAAILSLGRRDDEQTLNRAFRLCQQYPGRWEPVAILMWNGSPSAMRTLSALQKIPERYAVLQTASVQLQACLGQPAGPQSKQDY